MTLIYTALFCEAKPIIEFLRAIFSDLSQWKEHVFITQDAVDVFYINASVINSYVQLKGLLDGKA